MIGTLIVLLAVAGCGGAAGSGPASASADPNGTPEDVALRYVRATFSGDPSSARALVEPASQDAQKIVELGIGQQQLSARDLGVGATQIDGERATVVILGTLCRSAPKARSASPRDCVTNRDPASKDPIFRVFVARQPDQTWLVSLRLDAPDSTPPASEAATEQPGSAVSSAAGR